ncbi:MAG TPA: hypothetical protein VKU85_18000, partial [bacterium]|nr:hypothetical protein [bacterium]
ALPRAASAVLRPGGARDVPDEVVLFAMWAIVGGVAVSTLPFQPLRYDLPLVPALVYLSAWALTRAPDPSAATDRLRERAQTVLRWGLGALVLVQGLTAALLAWVPDALSARTTQRVLLLNPVEFHLTPFLAELARARSLAPFESLPREIAHFAAMALCGALALGGGGLVAVVAARPLVRAFRAAEAGAFRRAGIVVAIILASQGLRWALWIPDRTHSLPAMAERLDELVPPDAVVSPGGTYSLGSALRFDSSVVLEGGMYDADGGADYFVALTDHPLIGVLPEGEIERRHPGSLKVAVFHLNGGYTYALYRAAGAEARADSSSS